MFDVRVGLERVMEDNCNYELGSLVGKMEDVSFVDLGKF